MSNPNTYALRATARKAVKSYWERAQRYEAQNLEAARIILLAHISRYGGPGAGLVCWARATVERSADRRAA